MVFRCDIEPSILALLRAVKLAWTDVVQETSAEGDPQSNGAAESLVNVIKGHIRSIKLALESASRVEVPADHDLLTWLVPYAACTVGLQWVETARQRMNEMREGAQFHLWHSSVNECGGCLCSHPTAVWALWIHDLNKEGTWDRWTDRTRCLLALQAGCRRARIIKRLPPGERWTGSLLDEALGSELTPNALEDDGGRVGIRAPVLQPHEAVPLPPIGT